MPSENIEFLPKPEVLTFEELARVVRVFARMGISKIRLTGGEPLVRRDVAVLVAALRTIETIDEIAMTTNAMLLADKATELRRAGLDRLNISLDTLDQKQFQEITRRDGLQATLDGIAAAKAAGFDDIRLNAVAVKGMIESQIVPLVGFAIDNQLTLRFIEFMPLNSTGRWHENDVLTGSKIREIVEEHFGELTPVPREDISQPATDFLIANGSTQIGFISSVSEPFCASCNRLRITADGKIRNCLFSHAEWDLRGPLREGAGDEQLESIILDSVAAKKKAHGIGDEQFRKPVRAMYQIGG